MTSQNNNTSFLSTLGRMAKDHHHSVNAAHSTYYTSSTSQASSRRPSAAPTTSSSLSATSSTNSEKMTGGAYDYTKGAAAVDAYSIASDAEAGPAKSGKAKQHLSRGWEWVKEAAKEHHRGTNAAYHAHYGMGAPRPRK